MADAQFDPKEFEAFKSSQPANAYSFDPKEFEAFKAQTGQPPVQTTPSAQPGFVQQVAQMAAQKALPSNATQPLDIQGSNPAEMGVNAALQSAQPLAPFTRASATVTQGANKLGDMAGQAATDRGINPTVAKLLGLTVGAALDPQTYAMGPMGKVGGAAVDAVAKDVIGKGILSPIAGLAVAGGKKDIEALAANPLKILMSPSLDESGKYYGAVKKAFGVTDAEERLIAKAGDRMAGTARTVADDMRDKMTSGADMTVGELLAGLKGATKIATVGKGSEKALYAKDAQSFADALMEKAPEVIAAKKDYATGKLREGFMNLLPQNKGGGTSKLGSAAALAMAHWFPGALPLLSPAVVGAGTVAASGAYKAGKALLGNEPVATGLAGVFKNYIERQANQQP